MYDEFSRLTEVNKDEKSMLYTYNGDGLRRSKEVDGATTTFYYAGKKVIYEEDSEGNKYNNTLGINLIARSDGSQINYYLYNGHADVVLMVDEDGVRKNIYDYDAFGNIIKEVENGVNNPYRYAQYYYDEEIDYYYLKARFYNPYIGRFISEDSYRGDINDPLSLHLYTYSHNNPILYNDPDGHWVHIAIGALVGVVSQGIADVATNIISGKGLNVKEYEWSSLGTYAGALASGAVIAATGGASFIATAASTGAKATLAKTAISTVGSYAVDSVVSNVTRATVDASIDKDIKHFKNLEKDIGVTFAANFLGGKITKKVSDKLPKNKLFNKLEKPITKSFKQDSDKFISNYGKKIGGTIYKREGLTNISKNVFGEVYNKKKLSKEIAREGSETFKRNFLYRKAISQGIVSKINYVDTYSMWKERASVWENETSNNYRKY